MFVIADGPSLDAEVVQQNARASRIFAADQINFAQDPQSACGNVFEVPDWCCDNVERSRHGLALWHCQQDKRKPRHSGEKGGGALSNAYVIDNSARELSPVDDVIHNAF